MYVRSHDRVKHMPEFWPSNVRHKCRGLHNINRATRKDSRLRRCYGRTSLTRHKSYGGFMRLNHIVQDDRRRVRQAMIAVSGETRQVTGWKTLGDTTPVFQTNPYAVNFSPRQVLADLEASLTALPMPAVRSLRCDASGIGYWSLPPL